MSLIKCPECKKKVSDKAPNCLNCGWPVEVTDKTSKSSFRIVKFIIYFFAYFAVIGLVNPIAGMALSLGLLIILSCLYFKKDKDSKITNSLTFKKYISYSVLTFFASFLFFVQTQEDTSFNKESVTLTQASSKQASSSPVKKRTKKEIFFSRMTNPMKVNKNDFPYDWNLKGVDEIILKCEKDAIAMKIKGAYYALNGLGSSKWNYEYAPAKFKIIANSYGEGASKFNEYRNLSKFQEVALKLCQH